MIFLGFAASGARWINWYYGLLGFYVFSALLEGIYDYWRFRSEILEEQNQEEQNQQQNHQQNHQQNQVALNPMVLRLAVVVGNDANVNNGSVASSGGGSHDDEDIVNDPQPQSERQIKGSKAVQPLK